MAIAIDNINYLKKKKFNYSEEYLITSNSLDIDNEKTNNTKSIRLKYLPRQFLWFLSVVYKPKHIIPYGDEAKTNTSIIKIKQGNINNS